MVNMWMVRAGENAFLIDDFKENNIVAIGWGVGDLSGKTPNDIKKLMANYYPDVGKISLGVNSAQVIKFACDFNVGDYVITFDPKIQNYLVGKITSEYYYSEKLSKKHNQDKDFYHHFHDVEWIGESYKIDLEESALKPLKSVMTIFNLNDGAKNEILAKMDYNKIEWVDFYMEFAEKLLDYKNNRVELIKKIQIVFSNLNMTLPTLERDISGKDIIPYDIDPFTIFALFNKKISTENRINIVNQIKKEFSIKNDAPNTFHGVSLVNNLKSTFYYFTGNRGENDIDNLWKLYECAINFSENNIDEFIELYNNVLKQKGIKWNITIGLNWIRPFSFLNLDFNVRKFLSTNESLSDEFKDRLSSLTFPPDGEEYLKICNETKSFLNDSEEFNTFPELSHKSYIKPRHEVPDYESVHYWIYSPGKGAEKWEEFYDKGIMAIGWKKLGNLSNYSNKNEIRLKLQEINNDNSKHTNDTHAVWQFANKMKVGDIVFAKRGMSEIIGMGIIESDYIYDEDMGHFVNVRKVNWTNEGNWEYEYGKLPMKTLTDITVYQEMIDNIKGLIIDDEDSIPEFEYPKYTSENFLEEVYVEFDEYNTLVDLINNKKNLIIEGAPGVGKTFMAKRLAYSIMGVKDIERVMMVQFHQSYSYEDFVMGYRPYENGFKLKLGSFYKFCKKAEEDSENDYFFIIDEINRGNLSKIFGELFMLIEADKRGEKHKIQLLYSDELFFIPENVYIIGLMNTADRSLAMIDYALRRRFAFFNLEPGFKSIGFENYKDGLNNVKFNKLIEIMKKLNEKIKKDDSLGEGFRIGHSYLCNIKPDEVEDKLEYIIKYELIPLLKEYWFDDNQKVEEWSKKLSSVIDDSKKDDLH